MIIALLLYGSGFVLALAPDDVRLHIPRIIWVTVVLSLIMTFVALDDSITARSDFSNYSAMYTDIGKGFYRGNSDPGFTAILSAASWIGLDFRIVHALIAGALYVSICLFTYRLFGKRDWFFVIILYMNFFSVFLLLFSAIRQSLASSILLVAIHYLMRRRYITYTAIVLCASVVHISSIFALIGVLTWHRFVTVQRCVIVLIVIFISSATGVNSAAAFKVFPVFLIGYDKWNYYQGGELLATYTGAGTNRVDFLAFSIAPAILYVVLSGYKYRCGSWRHVRWDIYEHVTIMYLLWLLPFAFFAYMPFSDRFALVGWLLWPATISWSIFISGGESGSRDMVVRGGALVVLAMIPNIIQYMDTLYTVARGVQSLMLGL